MRKDHAVMLGIILIAVSIGTISITLPLSTSIPLDAFDTSENELISEATVKPKLGYEVIKESGWVIIEVYDKFGNQKYFSENKNLIVHAGLNATSDLNFGTTFTALEVAGGFHFIQLGSGTTNPDVKDTDCETPAGSKIDDTSVVNHPTLIGAIINATGVFGNQLVGQSISEICLTNNSANATGLLKARQEFTPFTFNDGDTVNATWTITMIDHDGT